MILDSVDAPPHEVVLEIEKLEASEQVLDEAADAYRQRHVAHRHRIHGEPAELLGDIGEREQILFDGDVERVLVLEVNGNYDMTVLVNVSPSSWSIRRIARHDITYP